MTPLAGFEGRRNRRTPDPLHCQAMTLYCSEASDLEREPDTPGPTAGLFEASEDHISTAVI